MAYFEGDPKELLEELTLVNSSLESRIEELEKELKKEKEEKNTLSREVEIQTAVIKNLHEEMEKSAGHGRMVSGMAPGRTDRDYQSTIIGKDVIDREEAALGGGGTDGSTDSSDNDDLADRIHSALGDERTIIDDLTREISTLRGDLAASQAKIERLQSARTGWSASIYCDKCREVTERYVGRCIQCLINLAEGSTDTEKVGCTEKVSSTDTEKVSDHDNTMSARNVRSSSDGGEVSGNARLGPGYNELTRMVEGYKVLIIELTEQLARAYRK
jgi:hypothetical protein